MEQSRRTILVISPDYVGSIWTRLEYQVAQQQMLRLRHKIIPIIYRDINHLTDLDLNLKLLLGSVTYLLWPGDNATSKQLKQFWKQLQTALDQPCHNKRTSSLFNRLCTALTVDRELTVQEHPDVMNGRTSLNKSKTNKQHKAVVKGMVREECRRTGSAQS